MSEEIQAQKSQFQQRDPSRDERFLERKMSLIENPYSIVILASNGVIPIKMIYAVMELDRNLNNLIRETGRIPVGVVKEKMKEAEALSESLWDQVKSVVPSLFDFDPKRWMELNDPLDQKRVLISRRNTRVFLRKTEQGAEIMTALKVLGRKKIEYASNGDIDSLDKMAKIFTSVFEKIQELNKSITEVLTGGGGVKGDNVFSGKK